MSSSSTNQHWKEFNEPRFMWCGGNSMNSKKKSEWITIELLVPFDFDLTRKIKIRKTETFGHLVHCWQMATGSHVQLPLVIHTCDGPKFIRDTDTPNDLKNVDYGEMVVFDLGPADVYWDDRDDSDD